MTEPPGFGLLKDILLRASPAHNSDPSPHKKHKTDRVTRASKRNQTHIAPPLSLQDFPRNRNADQSADTDAREASRKVPSVVLGSAELAGADGTERDVAARCEAEK